MATPVGAATFYGDLKDLVPVREWDGWRTRNRGTRGDGWGPVHGVMIHHTVTKSTKSAIELCRDGRSDLPGPLYNVVVDKQGTAHLIGWGRANHAGEGDDDVLRALIREQMPYPRPNEANTDGNARLYGIALLNMGDGEDPFPKEQLDTAATAAALLCGIHGWGPASVIGHKEWQRGKTDPKFGMGGFRTRVGGRLNGPVAKLFRGR
jgi:hypothetical protein